MDYFKHYSTASDSKSVNVMFDEYGHKGIAFWWLLLELCSDNWDGHSEPEFEFHPRTVATKLRSSINTVEGWLNLCHTLGSCAFAKNGKMFKIKLPKLSEVKTSRKVIKSNKNQLTVYIDKDIDKDIEEIAVASTSLFIAEQTEIDEIKISDKASTALTMLNALCFKNFRPVAGNIKYINARLKDGYTLDDFKTVITHKQKEWGSEPKWAKYLRPETIFGTKFDSYLQEANSKPTRTPEMIEAEFRMYL
jgi:uncharacterized phage protein (TIGR02220 family)